MKRADEAGEGCPFCEPEPELLLAQDELTVVFLNLFPYNTGHALVAPRRHVGELWDTTPEERHALLDATERVASAIRAAMSPHGFNTGMNLGRVAGAGMPDHIHMHVVPRWGGDTNFMPLTAGTKVLPETLEETAAKLRPLLSRPE